MKKLLSLVMALGLAGGAWAQDPASNPQPGFMALGGGTGSAVDDLAIVINTPGSCGTNNNQSIGFQFDVVQPVTVTGVCWADGMTGTHEVGLFDTAGTLIAATNQTVSNADALVNGFRCKNITPVNLAVGAGYIMAGYNGSGQAQCLAFNVGQTVHANLSYVDAMFSGANGIFERPTNASVANNGFYGCNFLIGAGKSCTDNETIKKVKCCKGELKVITVGGNPGETVTVTAGCGTGSATVDGSGNATVKISPCSGAGTANASWTCGAKASAAYQCDCGGGEKLPDLISTLGWSKGPNGLDISVSTTNKGEADAGASKTRLAVSDNGGKETILKDFDVPILGPGVTHTANFLYPCKPGDVKLISTADIENKVKEGKEGNNFQQKNIKNVCKQ